MDQKTAILFKAELSGDKSDPYLELLKSNGISATIIPTLEFKFINDETLKCNLQKAESFSGIIFTSPRAVEAVNRIFSTQGYCSSTWKGKANYSVGRATSNSARNLLGIDTIGEDTGTSEKLCSCILSGSESFTKPFLFPCSSLRRETIPNVLSQNGIEVSEVVCYETICNSSLKSNWEHLVAQQGLPDILIYFSPSGVHFSQEIVKATYHNSEPNCIAVGPSTAQALVENMMPLSRMSKRPTPEDVLDAIKSFVAN